VFVTGGSGFRQLSPRLEGWSGTTVRCPDEEGQPHRAELEELIADSCSDVTGKGGSQKDERL